MFMTLLMLCAAGASNADEKVIASVDYTTSPVTINGTPYPNEGYPFYRMDTPSGASYDVQDGALTIVNTSDEGFQASLQVVIADEVTTQGGCDYIVKIEYMSSVAGSVNVVFGQWANSLAKGDVAITASGDYQTLELEFKKPLFASGVDSHVIWQCRKVVGTIKIRRVEVVEISSDKPLVWTNIIVNSDLSGSDMSCFYQKVYPQEEASQSSATDGVIVINSPAIVNSEWDTQFFIVLPQTLPAGTPFKVSFKCKASAAATVGTQCHNAPGQYIHWKCFDDVPISTEWTTFETTVYVPDACDGSDNGGYNKDFKTISLKLTQDKDITYYFDNIVVAVYDDIAVNPQPFPVDGGSVIEPAFPDGTYYMMNAHNGKLVAANGLDDIGTPITFVFDTNTGYYTITGSDLIAGKKWIAEESYSVGFYTFYTLVDGVKMYAAVDNYGNFTLTEDGTAERAVWIFLKQTYWENRVLLSYHVAGTADLCGTAWDTNANKMTMNEDTGLFEWTAKDITVSNVNVPQFKIVVNSIKEEDPVAWYPEGDNWFITTGVTGGEGVFDITITFDFDTKEIDVTAVKTGDIGPSGAVIATFNLGEDNGVSDPEGFFTHDSEGKWNFNSKFNGGEYDGISFTKGLKIENSTAIYFTTTGITIVTIVQSTYNDNTITFDGEELPLESATDGTGCRIYTLTNVPAGDHTIGRGSGESGLFYIKVEKDQSEELVVLPAGVEPEAWALEGYYNGLGSLGSDIFRATEVAFVGTAVYVKGLAYYFKDSWLKGTLNTATGIVTFPGGQFVGEDEYGREYMDGFDGSDICDIKYQYNSSAKTLTMVTPYILESKTKSGLDEDGKLAFWGYWTESYFHAGEPAEPKEIEVPEVLATETYVFNALCQASGAGEWKAYSYQTQVGFDGMDVYFKGFSEDTSDMWAKGTLSEDGKTVTIPAKQYMGDISSYRYYVSAVDEYGDYEDIVLNYDAELGTFSTAQTIVLNSSMFSYNPYQTFRNVTITKVAEFAATPADPSIDGYNEDTNYPYINFTIPAQDTEGNEILTSKLFYTVWIEENGEEKPFVVLADEYRDVTEDWTEIPYDWDDSYDIYKGGSKFYINPTDANKGWKKFGIQSIYYGGGERRVSNIVWSNGAKTVIAPVDLVTETYSFKGYDLYYNDYTNNEVEIGFYGENSVYIQGLSEYLPDAWVMGTLEAGVLTIPKTDLGTYTVTDGDWSESYAVTFSGATFNYDAASGTFYSEGGYATYESPDDEYFYDQFKYVTLAKLEDYATTPADPEILEFDYLNGSYPYVKFNIPAVSAIDGKKLVKSKLAFQVYYYKDMEVTPLVLTTDLYPELDADMSEIPYQLSKQSVVFNNFLYLRQPDQEIDSWYQIGLQSIYYGGGEYHSSNVVWFNNETADGIASPLGETEEGVAIYNVSGQRLNKMQKGINIVGGKKILVK